MPAITPLQQSFSSGEITPDMYRRRALQVERNQRPIAEGVAELKNFITDPRGPVRARNGFRYLGFVVAEDIGSALKCGVTTIIDDTNLSSSNSVFGIDYSPNTGEVIYTFARQGGTTSNTVFRVMTNDDSVRIISNFQPTGMAKIFSQAAVGSEDRLFLAWQGAGTDRGIFIFDVADFNSAIQTINPGSGNSVDFVSESDTHLMVKGNAYFGPAVIDKTTWVYTGIVIPTDWTGNEPAAARRSATQFLVLLRNTISGNLSLFNQSGANDILIGDKLVDLDTNLTLAKGTALVVSGKAFWPIDYDDGAGTQYPAILVTDFDGNQLALVDSTIPNATWSLAQAINRLSPETGNDQYLWWFEGGSVYRMDALTYEIESCTPDPLDPLRIEFASAVQQVGDYMYLADGLTQDGFKVMAKTEAFVI